MSNLSLFGSFGEHAVRWNGDLEHPQWVAKDVCAILGLGNVSQAINGNSKSGAKGLDEDEKSVINLDTPVTNLDTGGGKQELLTVTEAGLYRLVFKSRKAEAKVLQRWVFHEVLPTIRKTGGYGVQQPQPEKSKRRSQFLSDDDVAAIADKMQNPEGRQQFIEAYLDRAIGPAKQKRGPKATVIPHSKLPDEAQHPDSHLYCFAQETGLTYYPTGRVRIGEAYKLLEQWYLDNGLLTVATDDQGNQQRIWLDSPEDRAVKAPNQLTTRLLYIFPKAKRGKDAIGSYLIGIGFRPQLEVINGGQAQ